MPKTNRQKSWVDVRYVDNVEDAQASDKKITKKDLAALKKLAAEIRKDLQQNEFLQQNSLQSRAN